MTDEELTAWIDWLEDAVDLDGTADQAGLDLLNYLKEEQQYRSDIEEIEND
jgi:hypothetical protein